MNLDELKTSWQGYSQKLMHTQAINEKIILSMIKDRSQSRLAKIQKEYLLSFFYMFAMLLLFLSVFAWNPFDFTNTLQYTPIALQTGCIITFLIILCSGYIKLDVDINNSNLDIALRKIISVYEKAQKVLGLAGTGLLVSGLLFPLAFLQRSIEAAGLWKALGIISLQTAVVIGLYFLASKLGFLRDRKKHAVKFKDDLNELQELRSMSAELRENTLI